MDEVLEPQIDDLQEKGLEHNAVGLVSSVTIGLASTAPAFSLAATVGYLALEVGNYAPAAIVVAFIPIIFIAIAYRELNRVIPDCGTTFTWGTKAFTPRIGWMGGWGVAVAGVIFMANAADVVGIYAIQLYGTLTGNPDPSEMTESKLAVGIIGVVFILVMSAINYRGIEGGAKMQYVMVGVQFAALIAVIVAALWQVSQGTQNPDAEPFTWSWFNPFEIDGMTSFVTAALLAIFIFWGFDTTLAINEETKDSARTPGRAAVISTVILLGTYVLVTVALQMYAGVEKSGLGSKKNADDVFAVVADPLLGSWGLPLLLLAVLISAAASMQTTIMPTARGTLAMGVYKALPSRFADVNPKYHSPGFSTVVMAVVATVFYIGFKFISEDILADTILSIGLAIAFYYAITGFSCAWYFRRDMFLGVRDFFVLFLLPLLGGLIMAAVFVRSAFDMYDPDYGYTVLMGIGGVFVMGMGALLAGVVVMIIWNIVAPPFFRGETLHRDTPVLVPDDWPQI